ncbi:MAG: hypothetical protein CMJ28_03555 [Phycisphaerae bacterium]|nr:hypothetical protein [Phycisphaerae bacterium]
MSNPKKSVRRSDAPPTWVLATGVLLMLVAFAACGVLSWSHIQETPVAGCGGGAELGGSAAQVSGSGCDRAKESVWSTLPIIGWPTAHIGMAWFAALAQCWTVGRGRLVGPARILGLLGGLGSLFLIGVMLAEGYLCRWCAIAHGANLAFLALALVKGGRKGPHIPAVLLGMSLTFGGLTFLLILAELFLSPKIEDVVPESEFKVRPQATDVQSIDPRNVGSLGLVRSTPLQGRWRLGPENAPIRLVMFTDPQCPDCKRVHGELEAILAERDDISVEVKFFLFCKDCNERAAQQNLNLHPNACWGATVSELAGEYGGPEAFHKMLGWLFSVDGKFTSPQALQPGFAKAGVAGYANDILGAIGNGVLPPDKKSVLEADAREGVDLGLFYTPMAFLNGQEVKDVLRPGALGRAIRTLSATDPQPSASAGDFPSTALGRLVSDWQEGPRPQLRPDLAAITFGVANATPAVVIGDMAEDGFRRDVPKLLQAADAGQIRLQIRLLPTNQAVNPASGFPQLQKWSWGGQAAIRIGQLRQDGDVEGAKQLFRELLSSVNPPASLQRFVQTRPDLLGREESSVLAEVSNTHNQWAALKRFGVRGLPVLVLDGRLATRTQIKMSDGTPADGLSEILKIMGGS